MKWVIVFLFAGLAGGGLPPAGAGEPGGPALAGYWSTTLKSGQPGQLSFAALVTVPPESVEVSFDGALTGVFLRDDGTQGDLAAEDGFYMLALPLEPVPAPYRGVFGIVVHTSAGDSAPWPLLTVPDASAPTPSPTRTPSPAPSPTDTAAPTFTPQPTPTPTATVAGETPTPSGPTYWRDIYSITTTKCVGCHFYGGIAPFPLTSYLDVASRAQDVKIVTQEGYMPPWLPDLNCQTFTGARNLSQDQIDTLAAWVDGGVPEGSIADRPDINVTTVDLGSPDVLLDIGGEFDPGTGDDVYRCFPVDPQLTQAEDVVAIKVNPGSNAIVHHVLIYTDSADQGATLDQQDPGLGYTCFGDSKVDGDVFGGWAPGAQPIVFPAGAGFHLSAGEKLVVQIHYNPTGSPNTDHTTVELFFANRPVQKRIFMLPLYNRNFTIPAGDSHYRVTAGFTIPDNLPGQVIGIIPHMHLLGQEMQVDLTQAGSGATDCLIHIPHWDFHWQQAYFYPAPIPIYGGDRVTATAFYDNSSNNPDNPNDPPIPVSWGDRTVDEMMLVYFYVTP